MNLEDIKALYRKPVSIESKPPLVVEEGGDPSSTPTPASGVSPVDPHIYFMDDDTLKSLTQQSIGMGIPQEQYINDFITDAIQFQLQGWSVRR